MKYFKNFETLQDLKTQYRAFAKQLHPDCGSEQNMVPNGSFTPTTPPPPQPIKGDISMIKDIISVAPRKSFKIYKVPAFARF